MGRKPLAGTKVYFEETWSITAEKFGDGSFQIREKYRAVERFSAYASLLQ